jgi:putative transcriptional regulator
MSIQHHPDDSTLVSYAAGALPVQLALVVAAHLERCPRCVEQVRFAERLGGALIDGLVQPPSTTPSIDRCWDELQARIERIEAGDVGELEQARAWGTGVGTDILSRYLPRDLEGLNWRKISRRIHQFPITDLCDEKAWVRLFLFDTGVAVPNHTHQTQELSMVLQGAYCDHLGRFAVGDVADLDATVSHRPVVDSDEPCIALIASDGRLSFENHAIGIGARWLGL